MSQTINLNWSTDHVVPKVTIDIQYSDAADARLALTTAYQAALQRLIPVAGQPKTQTFNLPPSNCDG